MTGEDLRQALSDLRVSTRQLAAELEVSAMWVSRRMTGEVEISEWDRKVINLAVDAIVLRRARAGAR